MAVAVVGTAVTGVLQLGGFSEVAVFIVAAAVLGAQAKLVGDATEHLGAHLGPGKTGLLQSGLGNLPELLIGIFSLRAGLVRVVQAALVGSILGNSLLVLGAAFLVGGLKHGPQHFEARTVRSISTLMLLAVAALAVPTLAYGLHTPASNHEEALSIAVAIVLLLVFAASVPSILQGQAPAVGSAPEEQLDGAWPLWFTVAVLAVASVGAALVSDWFVTSLRPAIDVLHLSEGFTGLVIVAIAGNAVENVVGVQLAARNQTDFAVSVILNSPLQIALALTPALVLLSYVVGGPHLTLVMPGLLVAVLGLSALISSVIVFDGESIWLEGVALIGLYSMIAASFWWG
jgi:Ca2+:H+ antiporter